MFLRENLQLPILLIVSLTSELIALLAFFPIISFLLVERANKAETDDV
jgi:hypothetical protein